MDNMNGVLAVMEEDVREDFNSHAWGVRVRRVRDLEDWLFNRLGGHSAETVPAADLQRRFIDGIHEFKLNDDYLGCCPLTAGTHDVRGSGAHYQVTLSIED
jgi:hypothetical protein